MTSFLRSDRSTPVAAWLALTALLVFAMVVIGGATRLTDSGLSITEWKPVTGAIPPLSGDAWQEAFAKYRQIPQYQALNPDMSLAEFKFIYFWEWGHRLLGRLVGLVFALPLVVFLVRRTLPTRLIAPCLALLALGGLQGLVGWWMVASGLSQRISVAPERLASHLGLAFVLFAALVWTALEAYFGRRRQAAIGPWPRGALAILALVFLQCILGALVAGNDAGRIYTDWPLMNGRLLPDAYFGDGLWGTIAHSQGAVQLHHRLAGYALAGVAVALLVCSRHASFAGPPRGLARVLGGVILAQAVLGVATLMAAAPLSLSLAHQALATITLALATVFAWRVRRV